MPLLEWNRALDLGVPAMDAEHQELVAAMNRIHELDARQADKDSIGAASERLVVLSRRHIADEEKHKAARDRVLRGFCPRQRARRPEVLRVPGVLAGGPH